MKSLSRFSFGIVALGAALLVEGALAPAPAHAADIAATVNQLEAEVSGTMHNHWRELVAPGTNRLGRVEVWEPSGSTDYRAESVTPEALAEWERLRAQVVGSDTIFTGTDRAFRIRVVVPVVPGSEEHALYQVDGRATSPFQVGDRYFRVSGNVVSVEQAHEIVYVQPGVMWSRHQIARPSVYML